MNVMAIYGDYYMIGTLKEARQWIKESFEAEPAESYSATITRLDKHGVMYDEVYEYIKNPNYPFF